ncbi:hypothetical protein E1B28_001711 [Marasmius oreades]|uniref:DUF6534 domain-containing protein n=1 Tax=Marasmius oreades TaxID=181124 RepID=A0A9P8AFT8_9AGAR|nr:uncharacterized protein E1B28_001711 [Marasmius oreades]KAG7099913.1 hypothetical protein E1B28_001711 [Marasmius oreades]
MDAAISTTIVWFLWKKRNTGVTRTTVVIHRIVRWTVQTGLIASAAFLVTLSTFLAMPDTLIWLGILAILSKVFSNCFLASLNARTTIQEVTNRPTNIPLSSWGETWHTVLPVADVRSTLSNSGSHPPRFPEDSVIDIHVSKEIIHGQ